MFQIEVKRKTQQKKRKFRSSACINSKRRSVRCSFRTAMDYFWKSRKREFYLSSESSEEGSLPYSSQQSMSLSQHHFSVQAREKLDRWQLESELEAKARNWKPLDKDFLQYGYDHIAGLPSPVQQYDHLRQSEQHVVKKVNEIFELVRDPFVVDTSMTCWSSCSCGSRSSFSTKEKSILSNEEERENEVPLLTPEHYSGLLMDEREQKKRIVPLQGSKSSVPRRRNAEFQNGVEERKQKLSSEMTSFLESRDAGSGTKFQQAQKKISGKISNNVVHKKPPKKSGIRRAQVAIKIDRNNGSLSSPKFNGGECNSRPIVKQTRESQQWISPKARKSNRRSKPIADPLELPSPAEKCGVDSDISSVKRRDSDEKSTVYNSYAVVVSSCNVQRDFRNSMAEMIIENNILYSEELEKLVQCYLTLNSDEFHDVILKAFEQVRSDLIQLSQ